MRESDDTLMFQVQAVTLQLYGKPLRLQESFWIDSVCQSDTYAWRTLKYCCDNPNLYPKYIGTLFEANHK